MQPDQQGLFDFRNISPQERQRLQDILARAR